MFIFFFSFFHVYLFFFVFHFYFCHRSIFVSPDLYLNYLDIVSWVWVRFCCGLGWLDWYVAFGWMGRVGLCWLGFGSVGLETNNKYGR